MVVKTGPAFSLDEVEHSHFLLDRSFVPRELDNHVLALSERIAWLMGVSAADQKYIAVLTNTLVEGRV